ncbi:HAD family acid phosphatase [Pacificibacter sp. AS14]|uniref:5'-nucleotidase, lipoprotein e(P4) family n=1 Tax=Pacificibacter sp. AS14 TaxID=3135785 RepID=UPI0031797279
MSRYQLCGTIAAVALLATSAFAQELPQHNSLGYAVAWKQTAAEYRALYHQGFNIAKMHLEAALENQKEGDKPLAIVSDLDDTLVHPLEYWGRLIQDDEEFFNDPLWDSWIPTNGMVPTPGSKEFLDFAAANGVEIFYVTSRNQGEPTWQFAKENILAMGFPLSDDANLTVLTDTSNKETRQDEILQDYDVVAFLGDSLNDFRRKYYIKGDVSGRIAAMEEDKDKYGSEYILFPNPTDGHWIAAIFGESEPPASDENRQRLMEAATSTAWDGE